MISHCNFALLMMTNKKITLNQVERGLAYCKLLTAYY
jgi:hypothetical protein